VNWCRKESVSPPALPARSTPGMTAGLTNPENGTGRCCGGNPQWIRAGEEEIYVARWRTASPKVSRMIRRPSSVNWRLRLSHDFKKFESCDSDRRE